MGPRNAVVTGASHGIGQHIGRATVDHVYLRQRIG